MTKQHTEPRSRLETLATENAKLKLQLKQSRALVRRLREEAAELEAVTEGAQWRERNWPASLTLQQKLSQVGLLLGQVFAEPEAAPVIKEVFGEALQEIARRCQSQHPNLILALEAQHVFPRLALKMTQEAGKVVPLRPPQQRAG